MNRHLIAIEISIVRLADQGVNMYGLSIDKEWLKRLDRKPVQCRGAIQQNRVSFHQLLQNIPHFWHLATKRLVLDLVKVRKGS